MKFRRSHSTTTPAPGKSGPFLSKTGDGEGNGYFIPPAQVQKKPDDNKKEAKPEPQGLQKERIIYNEREYDKVIISAEEYEEHNGKTDDNGVLYQFSMVNYKRQYYKLIPADAQIAEYPDEEMVVLDGRKYKKIKITEPDYHLGKGKSNDEGVLFRSYPDPGGKRGVRHFFKYVPVKNAEDEKPKEKMEKMEKMPASLPQLTIPEIESTLPQLPEKPHAHNHPPPRLYVQFQGNSTAYVDEGAAKSQIKQLVDYLRENPGTGVHLTGNTGGTGNKRLEGNNKAVLDQLATVDGRNATILDLQIGRARRVEKSLIEDFGIDPKRITVGTGSNKNDDKNRFVGIRIKEK